MSAEPVTVRKATLADTESISALGKRAFRETNEPIIGAAATDAVIDQTYSLQALRACIRSCAQTSNAFFLVAEQNGQLAGFLHYDTEDGVPELHRLYVHPEKKRHGIGTILLDALDAHLPIQTQYRLIVAAANRDALAFYQRYGFIEKTRIDQAYFPGVDLPPDLPTVPVIVLERAP